MKQLLFVFLLISTLSCKKEPDKCMGFVDENGFPTTSGVVQISNNGNATLTVYFISTYIIAPNKSAKVYFPAYQGEISYKFDGQSTQSITVFVEPCETLKIGLSN